MNHVEEENKDKDRQIMEADTLEEVEKLLPATIRLQAD
jgi:hypothetical protein